MKNTEQRKTILKGLGYKVYTLDGIYFIDTYGPYSTGYDSLQGVAEALYYAGYTDTKYIYDIA